MDMIINASLIRNERLKRAWSQEHLAQVSGLGLRTVQRIESGAPASLETVKALAAVLELPVSTLIENTLPAKTPSLSPLDLFKPWRTFIAGCTATLIALGSLFSMQGAVADGIEMDIVITLNGEQISKSRGRGESGRSTVISINELLKIILVPTIKDDRAVLVATEIDLFADGEFKSFGKPAILVENGKPARMRITNEGSEFQLDLIATIE
jgi:transcriptional regulator with XRE-family HTH domain